MPTDNALSSYLDSLVAAPRRGRPPGSGNGTHTASTAPNADRKTSVYFGGDLLSQIQATAARLDRSTSWVLAQSFKLAQAQLDGMGLSDTE